MANLITAEFRKVTTTSLWWALLIPTVFLAFCFSWFWGSTSAIVQEVISDASNVVLPEDQADALYDAPLALFALSRGINIASVFPMIFGALAITTELRYRTVTTTFLTAPSRQSAMLAKAGVLLLWGVVYGLVVSLAVSLGTLVGVGDSELMPSGGQWMLVLLAGVLQCALWTVVGLGVGSLIGSSSGSVVLLLIYSLIFGPVAEAWLYDLTDESVLSALLPGTAANGMTGGAAEALVSQHMAERTGEAVSEEFVLGLRTFGGSIGSFGAWLSGLVFAGWAVALLGLGTLRNSRRDIT